MDIREIREKYPQYSDISDEKLLQGLHAKFYSDMPYEQFAGKISGIAQPAQPAQPITAQPQEPTARQSVQASILGRVLQGARDPIDEAAALLPKGLQAVTSLGGNYPNPVSNFFGDEASRVQGINRKNETEYQAARKETGSEGMDIARVGGNIVSPVNLAIALKAPAAFGIGAKIAQGAGVGAAGGILTGEDVNAPDYWAQKAKDVALGGAIGGAIPVVTSGISRMIRPETNAKAAELLKQGITPTPGQILGGTAQRVEDKLQSLPIMGDMITAGRKQSLNEFNAAALNRALSPIGEKSTQIGRAGVAEVKQKLGAAYDDLLPKIAFTPDAQFNAEMGNLRDLATGLAPTEQAKFNRIMADALGKASPNGSMTGQTFKVVESELSNKAKSFASSSDAYQKELGDALNESLRIMRETLPRVNPKYGDRLQKINEGYANYARIRQAAASTSAGANEGVFTPAQLAMAAKALDKSAGKGSSATGTALMQDLAEQGTNVLSSKYPDSGTVGRLGLAAGAVGGGAALGSAVPVAAGLGVAGLPFVGPGRKISAALLTKRPEKAAELARLLRKASPALSAGVPATVLGD